MFRRNPLLRLIFSANTDPSAHPIIAEPTTSLTDVVMAGQILAYANRLRTGQARAEKSAALWALAIAAAGVASLAGAIHHALLEDAASQWIGA